MAVRTKFYHFKTSAEFVKRITNNSSIAYEEALVNNSNDCYYKICFIDETKQIYTHGVIYDCTGYDDQEVLSLIQNLRDSLNTKVDADAFDDLVSEVEENELVIAKALTDLNNKVEEILNNSTCGSYPQINHETNDTTFVLTPNTMHVWGIVDSLDLTLGESIEGVLNEYIFIFETGSEPAEVILPDSLKFESDSNLSIKPFKKYIVSIVNELIKIYEFGDSINNNITFEKDDLSGYICTNTKFPIKSTIYLYIGNFVIDLNPDVFMLPQFYSPPGSYPLGLSFDPNDVCPKTEIEDDTYKYIVPKYLSITED